MNYKVLYRKYRPDNFNDSYIGQKHVVTILKNSVLENKISHAYLFSGPRGTGKTSTARILAKNINCLNPKDGIACEKCDNCLSFNSNPDIIEIDAASNNGVDEIRELINNVKIMPTSMKYKIYIIDEVHMLSQSAFNALLLTLEEPPEHVIFILATTNIESVPITILSRCQRFDFKRINEDDIYERLKFVCNEEKIEYEDDGLKEIAILSDGGLRDALSILDQLSKNPEKITASLVSKEIGSVSNKKIEELIKALDNNDVEELDTIFKELQNANLNYKIVIKKIINILSEIGVKILKGTDEWNLSFDVCKKLVLDLNDLINKININVEPYLLMKMAFLGYIDNDKNTVITQPKKEKIKVKKNNQVEKKEEKIEVSKPVVKPKKNSDEKNLNKFIDTRINNCFVKASKKYLSYVKNNWEDFIKNVSDSFIKGLVSDTYVVTASDDYAIIVSSIPHGEDELNNNILKVEDLFQNNYKLVFISEDKWNEEKNKYISNLKNNYEYKYIEENDIIVNEDLDDMSSIADVFDIDKIEVE